MWGGGCQPLEIAYSAEPNSVLCRKIGGCFEYQILSHTNLKLSFLKQSHVCTRIAKNCVESKYVTILSVLWMCHTKGLAICPCSHSSIYEKRKEWMGCHLDVV